MWQQSESVELTSLNYVKDVWFCSLSEYVVLSFEFIDESDFADSLVFFGVIQDAQTRLQTHTTT